MTDGALGTDVGAPPLGGLDAGGRVWPAEPVWELLLEEPETRTWAV